MSSVDHDDVGNDACKKLPIFIIFVNSKWFCDTEDAIFVGATNNVCLDTHTFLVEYN